MPMLFRLLFFLIVIMQSVHAELNGRWLLTITGSDRLEFGTEHLAGGLLIPWQSELEFTLKDGMFNQGTGSARLLADIDTYSRPQDMFDCQQVKGVFASNSGQSFATPHLRYQAFPMLGKVVAERVQLRPYLEYPGNYYAVLYACSTSDTRGSFWVERSPRIARELGKRQNAQIKASDSSYSAHIKEVKTIPPGPDIELPLVDGLQFSLVEEYGLRTLNYSLRRIGDE